MDEHYHKLPARSIIEAARSWLPEDLKGYPLEDGVRLLRGRHDGRGDLIDSVRDRIPQEFIPNGSTYIPDAVNELTAAWRESNRLAKEAFKEAQDAHLGAQEARDEAGALNAALMNASRALPKEYQALTLGGAVQVLVNEVQHLKAENRQLSGDLDSARYRNKTRLSLLSRAWENVPPELKGGTLAEAVDALVGRVVEQRVIEQNVNLVKDDLIRTKVELAEARALLDEVSTKQASIPSDRDRLNDTLNEAWDAVPDDPGNFASLANVISAYVQQRDEARNERDEARLVTWPKQWACSCYYVWDEEVPWLEHNAETGCFTVTMADAVAAVVRQRDEARACIDDAWAAAKPHSTMTVGTELSDVIRDFIRQRDEALADSKTRGGAINDAWDAVPDELKGFPSLGSTITFLVEKRAYLERALQRAEQANADQGATITKLIAQRDEARAALARTELEFSDFINDQEIVPPLSEMLATEDYIEGYDAAFSELDQELKTVRYSPAETRWGFVLGYVKSKLPLAEEGDK